MAMANGILQVTSDPEARVSNCNMYGELHNMSIFGGGLCRNFLDEISFFLDQDP